MTTGTRWLPLLLLGTLLLACGGDDDTADDTPDAAPAGHSITLQVKLVEKDGKLSFLTPQAAISSIDKSEVIGKPYYVATFPAGFSSGNDAPIHDTWGTVGSDLTMKFATPATYADGAYDIVLVVYSHTPITDAMRAGTEPLPAAAGGDLATFTLSKKDVHMGDPDPALGTYRINVAGADIVKETENKTPADPMDAAQITAAFDDTVLFIP